ncbi:MAG TPA: DUF4157 domain-containing protein [Kofleriaceae bacterium]|nr:DUF4157 domain-containing protein [Kofleriaceae bacterium]
MTESGPVERSSWSQSDMAISDGKRGVRSLGRGQAAVRLDRGLPSFSLAVGRDAAAFDRDDREGAQEPAPATEDAAPTAPTTFAAPGGEAGPPLPPPTFAPGLRVQRASLVEVAAEATGLTRRDGADHAGGLIVDDESQTLTAGQMRKTMFLDELRRVACEAADRELRRVGRTADGCPYLDQMLARYAHRPAGALERSIRRYAPEARGATRAREYLGPVAIKLGHGVATWTTTGRLPDGLSPDLMTGGALEGGRFDGGPAASARGATLEPPAGAPQHKTAEGHTGRSGVDPAALTGRLGPGQPLDGAARGRMESAFGQSFAHVRVHADDQAAALSRELDARAFTLGSHVAFGAGELRPGTPVGDALLAHELAHVIQQGTATPSDNVPLGDPADPLERDADAAAAAAVGELHAPARMRRGASRWRGPGANRGLSLQRCRHDATAGQGTRARGDLRDPRVFATYEDFLAAFQELGTFPSRDTPGATPTGFQVLGDRPASDTSADAADHGVPRRGSQPGEEYIDRPTAAWVSSHLPPELRMAVYELPADCADVAVMLRHVWLYAQGRTETYGRWTIGVGAGATEASRAEHLTALIRDEVYSGSVSEIIGTPYASRSFVALEPLLHPGDVLVWEHHIPDTGRRRGGHTQTIQSIERDDDGHITLITLLQGNQPVFAAQAAEIQDAQRAQHQRVTQQGTLRDLPGRRIERSWLRGARLRDVDGVWTWDDREATSLIAAGPPSGVSRPATRRIGGERRRRITDWGPALHAASASAIEGVFEAFLFEVRAGLEGASPHADEIRRDAPGVAAIAGQRLAGLSISEARRRELAGRLIAQARSLGAHLNPSAGPGDRAVFTAIADQVRATAGVTEAAAPASPPP